MLRPGHVIALCVLALLTLGVVMVNSAGLSVDTEHPVTLRSILLSRSTVYMGLALLAMVAAAKLPVLHLLPGVRRPLRPIADSPLGGWGFWPLWVGAAALLAVLALVYIPGLSREVNGSHRWIRLPGLGGRDQSIQPSEIAKWGLVALVAWYAAAAGPRLRSFATGLLPALACIALVAGFVVLEDLGTGVLLGGVAAFLLLLAGAPLWQFLAMLPLGLLAFAAAVWQHPYRLQRLTAFLDPYADPMGSGFHMIQSMTAVANGELFGRGLGHGLQKFGYLPEDQTDFLFAIICEELGIVGAGLVSLLYIAILWAGWLVIRRQQIVMLKLLAAGVVAMVTFQAIINMFVVTGWGPTKGIALPLLSSGGTGWILTAASLGLVWGMDRLALAAPAAAPAVNPDVSASAAAAVTGGAGANVGVRGLPLPASPAAGPLP